MKEEINKCWVYIDGDEKEPTLELHTKKTKVQFTIPFFQAIELHNALEKEIIKADLWKDYDKLKRKQDKEISERFGKIMKRLEKVEKSK